MATTRLILLRHGESTSNVLTIATSALDGYPLTERGRSQAQAVGDTLVSAEAGAIYASPVLRARQTAAIVARSTGLTAKVIDGLEEIHVGDHEGHSGEDIVRRGTNNWEQWLGLGNLDHGFEGGESARQAGDRVAARLSEIVAAHGAGTVIVVSHGAALAVALMKLCDNLSGPFLHDHLLDNCGRVDVLVDDGRWRCLCWAGVAVDSAEPEVMR
jgi:broad specificity phosphatase PhoE